MLSARAYAKYMKKILPILILISALTVSVSAAFYSVFGLGKLFAGASIQVMIMAGSLEIAKLIIATALHSYWKDINILMKSYLSVAVITLIVITSAGIYGFLSAAYQETAAKDSIVTKEIGILELKKDRFEKNLQEYISEKEQVIQNISDLRSSLANPNQIQYVDRETGQLVTTSSSSARKTLESQLKDATDRRNNISKKVESLTDSVTRFEIQIVNAQANSETGSELGSLKYIANLTGKSMDIVVNWFIFLLIVVFDPLAVTMVILANYTFGRVYGKEPIETVVDLKSKDKNNNPQPLYKNYEVNIPEDDEITVEEEYVDGIPVEDDFELEEEIFIVDEQQEIPTEEPKEEKKQDQNDRKDTSETRRPTEKDMRNIVDKDILDISDQIKENIKINDLTESQKRNMTGQEIENWYKKYHKKKGKK